MLICLDSAKQKQIERMHNRCSCLEANQGMFEVELLPKEMLLVAVDAKWEWAGGLLSSSVSM